MQASDEETVPKQDDTEEWDVNMEIQLFYAMADHKPVGVNKHFQMVSIWEKLTAAISREITTHAIWKHLETLYDISALDESEPIPFPNDVVPFSLPESEFGDMIKKKIAEVEKESVVLAEEEEKEGVKSVSPPPKNMFRAKTLRDSKRRGIAYFATRRKQKALASKSRIESSSSYASSETPSSESEKDYFYRRPSQDSSSSEPLERSRCNQKSLPKTVNRKKRPARFKPLTKEEYARRGRRRRKHTSPTTPKNASPIMRRRT